MSTALITRPLYEIEDTLAALLESMEGCPPELQGELQQRIGEYALAEKQKVDNICGVLALCEYVAADADAEIKRLQERKEAARAHQERLEGYILRVMEARGLAKLEGRNNTLALRHSDAVVITDEAAVPDRFKAPKVTIQVSKADIKRAMKAGEEVPGADLEFRTSLVRK